ncbi:hypothetical protein [Caballeronia concitans]|uniref:Uncharacterized protein n=1 Tax=Caballeronia concitans TaxID=1777133 RepID=A0A658R551_9BURK|nr:hypothetical protein [Caballeronia concitans]SAL51396.1 hypothetical protein AWB72_05439 [Caballeronia concitans]
MGAMMEDKEAELRVERERREAKWEAERAAVRAQEEAYRRESERKLRRSKWMFRGWIGTLGVVYVYFLGPTIIRVLIKAAHEWGQLFHDLPSLL